MNPAKLKKAFPGIKLNFPIKTVTTFGVGGRVAGYWRVDSPEALMEAVRVANNNKIKYVVLAGGSNVVFGDKKLNKLVIHYHTPEAACLVGKDTICCNAGLPLAALINSAIDAGLAGIETLSGIPGTVGGAIVGNAGAYGQCISDHLTAIEIFDPTAKSKNKQHRVLTKTEGKFAYRDSIFKKKPWLVLRANFQLVRGDREALRAKSQEIIALREKKYPPGLKCPGSFFKNILVKKTTKSVLKKIDQTKVIEGKIPSGYLLESVGAKGMKLGGAFVAPVHGNLIINNGRAKYADVKKLADTLRRKVKKQFGIVLEEEVRYVL